MSHCRVDISLVVVLSVMSLHCGTDAVRSKAADQIKDTINLATDTSADDVQSNPPAAKKVAMCQLCESDANCMEGHRCVTYNGLDKLCLATCSKEDTKCPAKFRCEDMSYSYCVPFSSTCCIDNDSDTYGEGAQCKGKGVDCDDKNGKVHPGAAELCNGVDDDCDAATVDGAGEPTLGTACDSNDQDECTTGKMVCTAGALVCSDTNGDCPK